MVVESESIGPYFTVEGDPRITRLGRFLRRSSLDEIPQLLNVLRGDMSLVGPRPNVFAQRTDYTLEEWGKRHSVKPGITGLHQALYRSNSTLEQRNIIDLEYVDKQSFFLDLKIILWTAKQVLFKGGN
jgi:lipopolysaccharide/colanic/teichoic acid biosynthesis glycosyltransferase